jgi:hypothetical protein
MNLARALIRELVDKRLWPIAAVLVVALVAVPVALSRGGESADAELSQTPAGAPAGAGAATVAAVELAGPPSVRSRAGKVRDPFRRRAVETGAGSKPASDAPGASSGGAGDASAPSNATGGERTGETPTDRIDTTKTISVRFGRADSLRRIPRLKAGTGLPAGEDAVVRYAGVVAGTKLARFVAVNDVLGKTAGDAKCYEKDDACYALDMKAGDRQTFIVDGVTYEIEVVAVPQGGAGDSSTADAKVNRSYYRTKVRFGGDSTPAGTRTLSRLTPLPSTSDHAVIYLGVSSKGAAFLLGGGVTAEGEGECLDANCRIVALDAGESTLVDVVPAGGGDTRQYTLEVAALDKLGASAAIAEKMRARVHRDGRDVLRAMLEDPQAAAAADAFTYDADAGLLVPDTSKVRKVTG